MILANVRDIPLIKGCLITTSWLPKKVKFKIAEGIKKSIFILPSYLRCEYMLFHNLGSRISRMIICSKFLFITVKEKFPKSRGKKCLLTSVFNMLGIHLCKVCTLSPKHILLLYYNQRLLKFLSFISSKILQFSWVKKWFLHVKFLKLNFTHMASRIHISEAYKFSQIASKFNTLGLLLSSA